MHNIQYLVIKDELQLYRMYMPFLLRGGLFIPGTEACSLGETIFLLLQLPDDPAKIALTATAVWQTPAPAQSPRVAGTGFHFQERWELARARIEACCGSTLDSGQPTFTL